MAHGVVYDVPILDVSDSLVYFIAAGGVVAATEIGPGHEGFSGGRCKPEPGLEGEPRVGPFEVGRPFVYEEYSDASRTGGEPSAAQARLGQ
jgi:hypothetical protein